MSCRFIQKQIRQMCWATIGSFSAFRAATDQKKLRQIPLTGLLDLLLVFFNIGRHFVLNDYDAYWEGQERAFRLKYFYNKLTTRLLIFLPFTVAALRWLEMASSHHAIVYVFQPRSKTCMSVEIISCLPITANHFSFF